MPDNPLPFEPHIDPRRENFVVIGSCISRAICFVLTLSEQFRSHFNVINYWSANPNNVMSDFKIDWNLLASAKVIMYHPPGWSSWGKEETYVKLAANISSNSLGITFPYPSLTAFWPFFVQEPRNLEENTIRNPMQHPRRFPQGDSYILAQLRKGEKSPSEIVEQYVNLDISEMVDLNELMLGNLMTMLSKEKETDIKVVDFIKENYQTKTCFQSAPHISNDIVLHLANQVLKKCGYAPLKESILDSYSELVMHEVPIHPSVIRHFDLKFLDEKYRYQVDFWWRPTFEEYVENYVRFL